MEIKYFSMSLMTVLRRFVHEDLSKDTDWDIEAIDVHRDRIIFKGYIKEDD